jgi:hypothetical protein
VLGTTCTSTIWSLPMPAVSDSGRVAGSNTPVLLDPSMCTTPPSGGTTSQPVGPTFAGCARYIRTNVATEYQE